MKRYAITISFSILLLPLLALTSCAQSSQTSDIPAPGEGLVRACSAAAAELGAARKLIEAQQKEAEVARLRLETEKERAALMAEKNEALSQQIDALTAAIQAEREARAFLQQLIEQQRDRIAKLEDKAAKTRKRSLIMTLAGVVLGLTIGR